jgi:hypothetical protein
MKVRCRCNDGSESTATAQLTTPDSIVISHDELSIPNEISVDNALEPFLPLDTDLDLYGGLDWGVNMDWVGSAAFYFDLR